MTATVCSNSSNGLGLATTRRPSAVLCDQDDAHALGSRRRCSALAAARTEGQLGLLSAPPESRGAGARFRRRRVATDGSVIHCVEARFEVCGPLALLLARRVYAAISCPRVFAPAWYVQLEVVASLAAWVCVRRVHTRASRALPRHVFGCAVSNAPRAPSRHRSPSLPSPLRTFRRSS